MFDDTRLAEGIIRRREALAAMRVTCGECGSEQVRLVSDSKPAWWKCRSCKAGTLAEPEQGAVLLPQGARVCDGLVLCVRRDYDARRQAYYELCDAHPETASELIARVRKARVWEPFAKAPVRREDIIEVRAGRGNKRLIPRNYLPPRCLSMWKHGDLSAREAYSAAMYVYAVRTNFLIWSGGTNWPRHEKVYTSIRIRLPKRNSTLNVGHDVRQILDYCLVQEGKFTEVPGVEAECKTMRHREGKALMRLALKEFARVAGIV